MPSDLTENFNLQIDLTIVNFVSYNSIIKQAVKLITVYQQRRVQLYMEILSLSLVLVLITVYDLAVNTEG